MCYSFLLVWQLVPILVESPNFGRKWIFKNPTIGHVVAAGEAIWDAPTSALP
jgi:hypothetical protein